ncbi:hypothetical protein VDG1235_1984 [Verrucomicrobiia bacterium DG1235]|nr:hypothetical protein VDG1235_1984 [Verrucomicrobiae bacterium DG1235]
MSKNRVRLGGSATLERRLFEFNNGFLVRSNSCAAAMQA